MKVYEIISENKQQQVDEALPLLVLPVLGSVSIGAVISMVLTAWSVYDIIGILTKAGKDPESMTDADWGMLFLNLLLMLPVLKYLPKFAKNKIGKLVPDSWKQKGGEKIKDLVLKHKSKEKPTAKPSTAKPASSTKPSAGISTKAAVIGGAAAGIGGGLAVDKLSSLGGSSGSGGSNSGSGSGEKSDKFSRWFRGV